MITDIATNPVAQCDALSNTFALMKQAYGEIRGYVKNMHSELDSYRKQLEERRKQLDKEKSAIQSKSFQEESLELQAIQQQLNEEVQRHAATQDALDETQHKLTQQDQGQSYDPVRGTGEKHHRLSELETQNTHYQQELRQASQQIAQTIKERSNLQVELNEIRGLLHQRLQSEQAESMQSTAQLTATSLLKQPKSKISSLGVDPVVDSVLAQFQKVQQDAAKRRIQES